LGSAHESTIEDAMMTNLLTPEIKSVAQRSVLCWLATADKNGLPNVSPKEVFALVDDEHMVIANIASPQSAKNIQVNENVCVSFIDVFVQKGFKVIGVATDVRPLSWAFARWVEPLRAITGDRFPIHSVFVVRAVAVQAIEAPSYKLYPAQTT
jgi:predicted pyridoxine 5'-phosphate oxidase superfamily flavin-nucleotide-binding protein